MRIALVVSAALAVLAPAAAPAGEAVRITEATGQAAVADDLPSARAAAKDDALRRCVQQVAATLASAAAEGDQEALLADEIYAHAQGYLRGYQILDDRQDGNAWVTRLRCDVSEARLEEDLLALGIAYRRAGMPRVLALIGEQPTTATQATGWWQGGGRGAELRVMEAAFVDRMEKSGFTFVDPGARPGQVPGQDVGADPSVQQAREVGRLAGAEVVVVGRAVARPLGEIALDGGAFYSAAASVSARAVRTDTGEVIASAEFTSTAGKGFDRATAGRNALAEGGRQLARELFTRIGKVWAHQQAGAGRITMVVKGVDDYARLAGFKDVLVSSVRGVKDVQQRSIEDGRAELDVTLAGTTEAFATELATRKFPGYACKVGQVTPGAVEVELR